MKINARLEGETAKEYAYRILKENIISLELEPGSILNDLEVSQMIGISRTPVREAIIKLKEESEIIEIFPQKRMCIARIDTDVIKQVRFQRLTLEKAIVELACDMAQEEDFLSLQRNLRLQEFYTENQMFHELLNLDNALHKKFFTICRMDLIYQKSQGLAIHYDRIRNMETTTIRDPVTLEDHVRLVQAVRDKDKELAKKIMEQHLDRWLLNEHTLRRKYPQYFIS